MSPKVPNAAGAPLSLFPAGVKGKVNIKERSWCQKKVQNAAERNTWNESPYSALRIGLPLKLFTPSRYL